MTTEDLTRLPEQIRESVQAGRITAAEENAVQYIIDRYGNKAGLNTLQYFEKMNSIKTYFENSVIGFKMHEFYYGPSIPEAEKQKIVLALKEALRIMKTEGYQ